MFSGAFQDKKNEMFFSICNVKYHMFLCFYVFGNAPFYLGKSLALGVSYRLVWEKPKTIASSNILYL
jgi:hypothetical protein